MFENSSCCFTHHLYGVQIFLVRFSDTGHLHVLAYIQIRRDRLIRSWSCSGRSAFGFDCQLTFSNGFNDVSSTQVLHLNHTFDVFHIGSHNFSVVSLELFFHLYELDLRLIKGFSVLNIILRFQKYRSFRIHWCVIHRGLW